MHCTDVETLKARKPHRCMSCGEPIAAGETYKRWRCYDGGDASTNKMHPECLEMHQAEAKRFGDHNWEYQVYSHERPKADADAVILTPNVGGEARLAAHQPLHTTTATPQGVASTDQLGHRAKRGNHGNTKDRP